MTKFAACTIGVWAAAFTCAGALAYALRPPVPVAPMIDADGDLPAQPAALATAEETPVTTVNVVELAPTLVMVAPSRAAVMPPQPLAAEEVRCAPWRHLTQGAAVQQVRYCE